MKVEVSQKNGGSDSFGNYIKNMTVIVLLWHMVA